MGKKKEEKYHTYGNYGIPTTTWIHYTTKQRTDSHLFSKII